MSSKKVVRGASRARQRREHTDSEENDDDETGSYTSLASSINEASLGGTAVRSRGGRAGRGGGGGTNSDVVHVQQPVGLLLGGDIPTTSSKSRGNNNNNNNNNTANSTTTASGGTGISRGSAVMGLTPAAMTAASSRTLQGTTSGRTNTEQRTSSSTLSQPTPSYRSNSNMTNGGRNSPLSSSHFEEEEEDEEEDEEDTVHTETSGAVAHVGHFTRPLVIPPSAASNNNGRRSTGGGRLPTTAVWSWFTRTFSTTSSSSSSPSTSFSPLASLLAGFLVACTALFFFAIVQRTRALGGGPGAFADAFVDVTGFSGLQAASYVPRSLRNALGLNAYTSFDGHQAAVHRAIQAVNETAGIAPIDWELREKLVELVYRLSRAEDSLYAQKASLETEKQSMSQERTRLEGLVAHADIARERAHRSAEDASTAAINAAETVDERGRLLATTLTSTVKANIIAEAESIGVSINGLKDLLSATRLDLQRVEGTAGEAKRVAVGNEEALRYGIGTRVNRMENETVSLTASIATLGALTEELVQDLSQLTTTLGSETTARVQVDGRVSSVNESVTYLMGRAIALAERDEQLNATIENLRVRATALSTQATEADTKLTTLAAGATTLTTSLQSLSNLVNASFTEVRDTEVSTSHNIGGLQSAVTVLQQAVSALNTSLVSVDHILSGKANATQVTELAAAISSRVANLSAALDILGTRIHDDLTNASKTVEQGMIALSSSIASDIRALNTTLLAKLLDAQSSSQTRMSSLEQSMLNTTMQLETSDSTLLSSLVGINSTLSTDIATLSQELLGRLAEVNSTLHETLAAADTRFASDLTTAIENVETSLATLDATTSTNVSTLSGNVYGDLARLNSSLILRLFNMNATLTRALDRIHDLTSLGLQTGLTSLNASVLDRISDVADGLATLNTDFTTASTTVDGRLSMVENSTTSLLSSVEALSTVIETFMVNTSAAITGVQQAAASDIELVNATLSQELENARQSLYQYAEFMTSNLTSEFTVIEVSLETLRLGLQDVNSSVSDHVKYTNESIAQVYNEAKLGFEFVNETLNSRISDLFDSLQFVKEMIGFTASSGSSSGSSTSTSVPVSSFVVEGEDGAVVQNEEEPLQQQQQQDVQEAPSTVAVSFASLLSMSRDGSIAAAVKEINNTAMALISALTLRVEAVDGLHDGHSANHTALDSRVTEIAEALATAGTSLTTFQTVTNTSLISLSGRIDAVVTTIDNMNSTFLESIAHAVSLATNVTTTLESKVGEMQNLTLAVGYLVNRLEAIDWISKIDEPLLVALLEAYNASLSASRGVAGHALPASTSIWSSTSGVAAGARPSAPLDSSFGKLVRNIWPDGTRIDGIAAAAAASALTSSSSSSSSEAGKAASSGNSDRVALLSDVSALVDRALAAYATDTTTLPDYAAAPGGGCVVDSLTSKTWKVPAGTPSNPTLSTSTTTTPNTASSSTSSKQRGHPPQHQLTPRSVLASLASGSPYAALVADTSVGQCWPMEGNNGTLGVKLATPIMIMAVTIDHLPRELTLIRGDDLESAAPPSAPRHFAIYGVKSDAPLDVQARVLLGTFEYDAASGPPTQTFHLHPRGAIPVPRASAMTAEYPMIQLEINDNWGSADFTCLYRFRVHGYPVSHANRGDTVYFTQDGSASVGSSGSAMGSVSAPETVVAVAEEAASTSSR